MFRFLYFTESNGIVSFSFCPFMVIGKSRHKIKTNAGNFKAGFFAHLNLPHILMLSN